MNSTISQNQQQSGRRPFLVHIHRKDGHQWVSFCSKAHAMRFIQEGRDREPEALYELFQRLSDEAR